MRIHFPSHTSWIFGIQKKRIFALVLGYFFLILGIFFLWNEKNSPEQSTRTLWLIDSSLSMGAIEYIGTGTTTRIDIVKDAVRGLIESGVSGENAISIFAADTRMVTPFSRDIFSTAQFLESLPLTRYGGGSDITLALNTAIDEYRNTSIPTRTVLITDGGDCIETACDLLIKKYTNPNFFLTIIGVGNTDGMPIPLGQDVFGNVSYKMYQGEKVLSARNDSFLENLAKISNAELFLIDPDDISSWKQIFSTTVQNPIFSLLLVFLLFLLVFFIPRFSRIPS